ncbi:hypothetical protein TRAPUB_3646, partial [Trametes pubescens]
NIFHDPTDMAALTPAECAPYGPTRAESTLTSASLTERERAVARLYPTGIIIRPATAAASTASTAAAASDAGASASTATVPAPGGGATAEADSDDDMPPLVSPTSSELEIGDF